MTALSEFQRLEEEEVRGGREREREAIRMLEAAECSLASLDLSSYSQVP